MSFSYSPNGSRIATAGGDFTVRIWDAITGREIIQLCEFDFLTNDLAFSPDGRRILAGGSTQTFGRPEVGVSQGWSTLRIWDVETGQLVHLLPHARMRPSAPEEELSAELLILYAHLGRSDAPPDEVHAVTWLPDSERFASGGKDGVVRVWDVNQGQELWSGREHVRSIETIACSADGKLLASGASDGTIRIWDVQSGTKTPFLGGHSECVLEVIFTPSGNCLASASADGTMRIWNIDTGECIKRIEGLGDLRAFATEHHSYPFRLLWRNEETILEASGDGRVVAGLPTILLPIASHLSGCIWAGGAEKQLFIFSLELGFALNR